MAVEKTNNAGDDVQEGLGSGLNAISSASNTVSNLAGGAGKLSGNFSLKAAKAASVSSGGGKMGLIIIIAAVVLILLVNFSMSTIESSGTLGMTGSDETNREAKQDILAPVYKNTKWKQRGYLVKKADEKYDCGADITDKNSILNYIKSRFTHVEEEPDQLEFTTDKKLDEDNHKGCEITFDFYPGVEDMTNNVTAYAAAVDATIAYFDGDYFDEDGTLSQEYVDKIENAMKDFEKISVVEPSNDELGYKFTDEFKNLYKELDGAQTDAGGVDAIGYIAAHSKDFFVCDTETSRWEHHVNYVEEEREEIITKEVTHRDIIYEYDSNGNIKYAYPVDTVTQEEEVHTYMWRGYQGTIIVPMYYGLEPYREDELQDTITKVTGKEFCKNEESPDTYVACDAYMAEQLVSEVLKDYYNTYQQSVYGAQIIQDDKEVNSPDDLTSLNQLEVQDNRNQIFRPIYGDVKSWDIPVYGLENELVRLLRGDSYLDEIAAWSPGSYDFFATYTDSAAAWAHVNALIAAGIVTAVPYNCTAFAQAWLYDHYGWADVYGHGGQMASNAAGKHGWTTSSTPVAGGLVSFGASSSNKYGHIACVESVDYANGTITISEGNLGRNHATATTTYSLYGSGSGSWAAKVAGRTTTFSGPTN